jgi:Flp pilus assembly protein TadD
VTVGAEIDDVLDPSLVGAHLILAEIALEEDRRTEAVDAIRRALAINPRSPEAHALLGGVALLDGRTADFEAERANALAVNPASGEFYREVAWLMAGNNRFNEATVFARRAVDLEPGNARAQAELGMHLMRTGNENEARRVLEGAFDADRSNRVTMNLLTLLDTLAADRVVVWLATKILRRNLLQLALRVEPRRPVRARVRVRRLTPTLAAAPRQVPGRITLRDDDLVPRHVERFGCHPRRIERRVRAEVSTTGLNVQLAVRLNRQQTVVSDRPGGVSADSYADTAHLCPDAFPAR